MKVGIFWQVAVSTLKYDNYIKKGLVNLMQRQMIWN